MTRNQEHPDVVRLSPKNWIVIGTALFSALVIALGAAWAFTNSMVSEIAGLRSDVRAIHSQFSGLERRLERLEERQILGARSTRENSR